MKKYTKIAYIILILVVLLFGFFIYKVSGKNNSSEDIKSKTISEVKYVESKFSNLFNQLNNINFENYTISSKKIKEDAKEKSSSESESSKSQGGSSKNSQESGSSEESSGNEESSSSGENSSSSDNNQQYNLERSGVLTSKEEIDWKQIKNDVEDIYTSLYTMTIDLYQTTTNQQDIINFNKEYDNLTKAVKDENKENTLMELSRLYNYLPNFIENCTDDEKEKILIKTKNNIFKAYSILEKGEWTTISENINVAIQEFTKMVTDVSNQENKNQYNINKTYIMINELQNAVSLKDNEVFLIKYKNLLEELKKI